MKFVTIRDMKINGSKLIEGLKGEDAVITKYGKPVAVVLPIDEDSIEEFIIAHNPKLLAELSRAYVEYQEKGGTDLDTVKKELKRRRG